MNRQARVAGERGENNSDTTSCSEQELKLINAGFTYQPEANTWIKKSRSGNNLVETILELSESLDNNFKQFIVEKDANDNVVSSSVISCDGVYYNREYSEYTYEYNEELEKYVIVNSVIVKAKSDNVQNLEKDSALLEKKVKQFIYAEEDGQLLQYVETISIDEKGNVIRDIQDYIYNDDFELVQTDTKSYIVRLDDENQDILTTSQSVKYIYTLTGKQIKISEKNMNLNSENQEVVCNEDWDYIEGDNEEYDQLHSYNVTKTIGDQDVLTKSEVWNAEYEIQDGECFPYSLTEKVLCEYGWTETIKHTDEYGRKTFSSEQLYNTDGVISLDSESITYEPGCETADRVIEQITTHISNENTTETTVSTVYGYDNKETQKTEIKENNELVFMSEQDYEYWSNGRLKKMTLRGMKRGAELKQEESYPENPVDLPDHALLMSILDIVPVVEPKIDVTEEVKKVLGLDDASGADEKESEEETKKSRPKAKRSGGKIKSTEKKANPSQQ